MRAAAAMTHYDREFVDPFASMAEAVRAVVRDRDQFWIVFSRRHPNVVSRITDREVFLRAYYDRREQ